jgi:outer membrane protein
MGWSRGADQWQDGPTASTPGEKAIKFAHYACAGLALFAGPAAAEPLSLFGYNLSITVQGATASAYQGSRHYSAFPSVSVSFLQPWEYDAFGAPDDSPSIALLNFAHVQIGAVGNFIPDRGNSHALRGMKDINWAGEGGGYVNWWPTDWTRIRVEALQGAFSETGLLVNTAADVVTRKGRFTLSTGPRFAWADSGYNNVYFGVSPAEAETSRFHTAYQPGAGPLTAGLEGAVEYRWFGHWRLDFSANYDRLLGRDVQSPIVRAGSANQYSMAAGVRFILGD